MTPADEIARVAAGLSEAARYRLASLNDRWRQITELTDVERELINRRLIDLMGMASGKPRIRPSRPAARGVRPYVCGLSVRAFLEQERRDG